MTDQKFTSDIDSDYGEEWTEVTNGGSFNDATMNDAVDDINILNPFKYKFMCHLIG